MLCQIASDVKHRAEQFGGIAQAKFGSLVIMDANEYRLFLSFQQPQSIDDLQVDEADFVSDCLDEGLLAEIN